METHTIQNQLKKASFNFQQGDTEGFNTIYELLFNKIYNFIYFRISHKENAEDLTEEVFIKAYKSLRTLKDPNKIESWIYQIAKNKIIDYYRAKKETVNLSSIENTLHYHDAIIDKLTLNSQQLTLLEVLVDLPEDQKQVINYRFFEELSLETISELMDKPQGTIRVLQHRAITKLSLLIQEKLSKYDRPQ